MLLLFHFTAVLLVNFNILVSASEFHVNEEDVERDIDSSGSSNYSAASTMTIASSSTEYSTPISSGFDSEASEASEAASLLQSNSKASSVEDQQLESSPRSQLSSLTSSSPEQLMKFIQYDATHTRPRGSSFHSTAHCRKDLHVTIGWVQYSDDAWMPSVDMEDNCENREHIRNSMLADARHGNLEYFRCLKALLDRFDAVNPHAPDSLHINSDLHELDFYNPSSMIFAAVQGDNVDLFLDVMAWKGITFTDLDPFAAEKERLLNSQKKGNGYSPCSYPPKRKSFLDDESSSSSEDEDNGAIPAIDETIFGQCIVRNSIQIFRLLLDNGIRDNYPEHSQTALHLAIKHGHDLMVRLLLDQGGSQVDRVDGAYQSPLMAAVTANSVKIVKTLLSRGASLLYTDFNRKNVLHYAAEVGNLDILVLLKDVMSRALTEYDAGSLINGQDLQRNTPVHLVADEPVYSFLVNEMGADPYVRNAKGQLPIYSR